MPTGITLEIRVAGHKAGDVQVTQDQVVAAVAEWNSAELTAEREKWVANRRQTKIFWCRGRCYPPKQIMRLATREQVRELAEHSRFKRELEDNLSAISGGYEVQRSDEGARQLGYKVEGGFTPEQKAEHGA